MKKVQDASASTHCFTKPPVSPALFRVQISNLCQYTFNFISFPKMYHNMGHSIWNFKGFFHFQGRPWKWKKKENWKVVNKKSFPSIILDTCFSVFWIFNPFSRYLNRLHFFLTPCIIHNTLWVVRCSLKHLFFITRCLHRRTCLLLFFPSKNTYYQLHGEKMFFHCSYLLWPSTSYWVIHQQYQHVQIFLGRFIKKILD